jgi:signal transduction histidine kinase/FixJ family two-component response regulator
MDILLPLIENVALLALAALIYIAIPRSEDGVTPELRSILLGLSLGTISAVVMLIPAEWQPGLIFDARGAPVLMSALLGGPIIAGIAVIPPIAMRISIGGIGMVPGVAGLAVLAICSVVAWWAMRRWSIAYSINRLLAFSAGASLLSLPAIFLLPNPETGALDPARAATLLGAVWPIIVGPNIGGTAILALLIGIETKRRAMLDSLRESEAAAQQALEVRTRFIAMMSHELRTPLNVVLGYAQLLDDASLSTTQSTRLTRLSDAASNLLQLIDDILSFSRFQTGSVVVATAPMRLGDILETAVDTVRGNAAAKGLTLRLPPDDILEQRVDVDGSRLLQALTHVLTNAVQFTSKGSVTVEARLADNPADTLRITVRDTGIGIPAHQIDSIFEPFERLGTTPSPGTGLGMAIVRAVMQAIDGEVIVRSTVGEGTDVTLLAPAKRLDPLPAPQEPATPEPSQREATAARVLVVDDIEVNADIACALLNNAGCSTESATNGQEAVEAVRAGAFDAVVMDIEMPVMDGLAATREIRDEATPEPARSVPIIALTAYASRVDMQACLEAGMTGYLTKPVDRDQLYGALTKCGVTLTAAVPTPAAELDTGEPVFSQERFDTLTKLVPAATLNLVLGEAATQIESLGAQVLAPTVESDDKRQAMHKLVSIAGNIGLLQLSALSRRYQDKILAGDTLESAEFERYGHAVDAALQQLASLRDERPKAADGGG